MLSNTWSCVRAAGTTPKKFNKSNQILGYADNLYLIGRSKKDDEEPFVA